MSSRVAGAAPMDLTATNLQLLCEKQARMDFPGGPAPASAPRLLCSPPRITEGLPEALRYAAAARETSANVLSVSPAAGDHADLHTMLEGLPWNVTEVQNCSEAIEELGRNGAPLVLCEAVLEDGTWKDILDVGSRTTQPALVIVTSRRADAYLWSAVLNLGGFDVLAKPFRRPEVRHVLTSALYALAARRPRVRAAAGS